MPTQQSLKRLVSRQCAYRLPLDGLKAMDTATPLVCWTLIILAAWRADEAAAGASEASCFAPFFAADCSLALLAEGRRWLFSGGGAGRGIVIVIVIIL